MPGSTLDLGGYAREVRALGAALAGQAHAALFAAAHRGKRQAIEEIDATTPYPPTDLGQMRRSYEVNPDPRHVRAMAVNRAAGASARLPGAVGHIVADPVVELENVAPHAAHQEYGTRPGHIFPEKVGLPWAQRKTWRPKKRKARSRRTRAQRAADPPSEKLKHAPRGERKAGERKLTASQQAEAEALYQRAKWSIYKRGIKPKQFHERASQHFPRFVVEEMRRRYAR